MDSDALVALAEARFQRWCGKTLRPERDRLLNAIRSENLTTRGTVFRMMEVYRAMLDIEVRKRISVYGDVARERNGMEILSKGRLDEYREKVMTSVEFTIGILRDQVIRYAHNAGDHPDALPNEIRYIHLKAKILDAVNDELRVLEAEGRLESTVSVETPELMRSMRADVPRPAASKNPRYRKIDDCLLQIAKSSPQGQAEVIAYLQGRVGPPNAEPFRSAKGWEPGFKKDRFRAGTWLSKRWARLNLPALPRGPKK